MKLSRARIVQIITIVVVHAISLFVLQFILSGLQIDSFAAAIGASIAYTIAQAAFWFVFIEFLSWMPAFLRASSTPRA